MYFQLLDTTESSVDILPEDVTEKLSLAQQWLQNTYNWFLSILPGLIAAIVIFLLGWWATKLICKLFVKAMDKSKADDTVTSFLSSIVNTGLKIVVLVWALATAGFDVTTLIAAMSAAAVTIGLALKDSLANVASGTLIILNKKFKMGDYLETEGLQGEVIKIEMMYTTLKTYDNKEVMIPNSRLTSNNITNYFVREHRRVDLIIPIAYEEDIHKARAVIESEIHSHKKVLQEMNNKVAVGALNESSVDMRAWAWCNSEDYWTVKDDLQESIKLALDRNHISIPFNQLDVHLIESNTKK